MPVTGKRDHIFLTAPSAAQSRRASSSRLAEAESQSARPRPRSLLSRMTAATSRPLPEPGAVTQHPAATEPDLRRERLTVLGSGCIDAHLAVLFRAAADGLPAGADPVAGGEMTVVGLACQDDALDLGVR